MLIGEICGNNCAHLWMTLTINFNFYVICFDSENYLSVAFAEIRTKSIDMLHFAIDAIIASW